jgi:hypothetical protein
MYIKNSKLQKIELFNLEIRLKTEFTQNPKPKPITTINTKKEVHKGVISSTARKR